MAKRTTRLLRGDAISKLRTLKDASIDSIVTDPPYELGFMGKDWDNSGIAYNVELWEECLRVLKPGGHLLAFGGTRTYHRMTVAIEDAGFEIRDSIHWIYGSGFPKSLDVSKAIDKQRDDRADIYKVTAWVREARDAAGITNKDIDAAFATNGMGRHWTDVMPGGKQPAVPTLEQVPHLLDVLGVNADDVPQDIRRLLWDLNGKKGQPGENWAEREVIGHRITGIGTGQGTVQIMGDGTRDITAPATDAAKQWQGWGTALKPGHEPIVVARKPLCGTVAGNVLEHGTGALNIDGCRIGTHEIVNPPGGIPNGANNYVGTAKTRNRSLPPTTATGRWPANIIFDEAASAELDAQSGNRAGMKRGTLHRGATTGTSIGGGTALGKAKPQDAIAGYDDEGGASRFFYCPKPAKKERNAGLGELPIKRPDTRTKAGMGTYDEKGVQPQRNFHPTVKPIALMRYLVRLVTPPGGIVLDPFLGSGTTAAAAILEGFDWRGCEMTAEYYSIIRGRVKNATAEKKRADAKARAADAIPIVAS